MTAIVGMIDKKNKKTYLGSDTMGSNGYTGHNWKTKKVFKNKHIGFAICGSYRMGQILNHNLKPRAFMENETVDQYVFDYLEKEFRTVFSDRGFLSKKEEVESIKRNLFIFTIRDRMFVLQGDLAILEPSTIYTASGSGEFHLQASVHTQLKMNPKKCKKEILKDAIEYTGQIVLSVGGEAQILEIDH